MKSRDVWIWGGLLAVTVIVVLTCAGDLLSARHELEQSVSDLTQCRSYARNIRDLNQRPRLASTGPDLPEQTLRRVSQSMQNAGIAPSALVSVSPSEPIRIAGSQYQRRSTELTLRRITLSQLADLADLITVDEDGSVLRDVVLTESTEPAENAGIKREEWDARLTLTQLIYSPTSQ